MQAPPILHPSLKYHSYLCQKLYLLICHGTFLPLMAEEETTKLYQGKTQANMADLLNSFAMGLYFLQMVFLTITFPDTQGLYLPYPIHYALHWIFPQKLPDPTNYYSYSPYLPTPIQTLSKLHKIWDCTPQPPWMEIQCYMRGICVLQQGVCLTQSTMAFDTSSKMQTQYYNRAYQLHSNESRTFLLPLLHQLTAVHHG